MTDTIKTFPFTTKELAELLKLHFIEPNQTKLDKWKVSLNNPMEAFRWVDQAMKAAVNAEVAKSVVRALEEPANGGDHTIRWICEWLESMMENCVSNEAHYSSNTPASTMNRCEIIAISHILHFIRSGKLYSNTPLNRHALNAQLSDMVQALREV